MIYSVLLAIGLLLNFAFYCQTTRRATLWLSFASTAVFGLYNFAAIAVAGGFICLISMANTALQALCREDIMARTQKLRLAAASIAAITGACLLAQTKADYLFLFAFIIVCYADTCAKQIWIYTLYLAAVALWTAYALMYGDFIYSAINMTIFACNFYVCLKYLFYSLRETRLPG